MQFIPQYIKRIPQYIKYALIFCGYQCIICVELQILNPKQLGVDADDDL